jgi:uracil-DNA glycosylase family 4
MTSAPIAHDDEPMHLPVFGPEFAKCNECELQGQCKTNRWAPSAAPTKAFNGLMIVGEGPGTHELLHKAPFVGPSGKLLDCLLENSGIDRSRTYVTNATLCKPTGGANEEKKGFAQRFPNAIPSCRPRLEAEIEACRPKGIVALGAAALVALTGRYVDKVKQVDNPCLACREDRGVVGSETRKLGPVLKCAVGECDWHTDIIVEGQDYKAVVEGLGGKCPKCSANIKRLRPRAIKCPACKGLKKQMVIVPEFKIEYGLKEAAGGLFIGEQLPEWLRAHGVEWVIASWHPAWILRSGKEADDASGKKFGGQFAARAMRDHLEKAKKLLNAPWRYDLEVEITDRPEDVLAYIADETGYSCDIETNSKIAWDVSDIRCIGIGHPGRPRKLVVDTRHLFKVTVTEHEDRPFEFDIEVLDQPLFDVLKAFLVDPKRPKAGTNFGQYDTIVLWRFFGVQTLPIWADVVSTHHILYPDEPHDLGHVSAEMTMTPHWKEPKAQGGVLRYRGFGELAEYNARDCRNTELSLEVMAGQYAPAELQAPLGVKVTQWTRGGRLERPDYNLALGHAISTALVPIAARMSYMGLPLDLKVLKEVEQEKLAPEDNSICEKCTHFNCMKARIIEMTGRPDFKISKPTDIAWALFDPMGPCKLSPPVITAKGTPSTKKDVLAKLAGKHPLVDEIRIAKQTAWVFSNYIYGKKLILREDGRFHPKWNISFPVTFRWSSEPNVQNISRWLRKIFRAPPGWVIVGADESQLELRILAALCGDPELIRRCRDANEKAKTDPEQDPHSFVASHYFGLAFMEGTGEERKVLREIAKQIVYANNYKAGPTKIRDTIYNKGYSGPPLELQVIKGVQETINKLFPKVQTWGSAQLQFATRNLEVRSPILNRWRPFPLPPSLGGGVEATVAANYPIQACAADIVDLCTIKYAHALEQLCPEAWIMAQVHDAVYTMCPEDRADEVKQLKEQCYSFELQLVEGAPAMPFVASGKIGHDWAEVS